MNRTRDVVVVGAGAAGTFAALGARGVLAEDGATSPAAPDAPDVLLVDGQDRPGRKILISGGGRCNVTNADVRDGDVVSSRPRDVRAVLRAFPSVAVRRFLADHGVPTHVEALGKVFPDPPARAREVLAAIDRALADAGVERVDGDPVVAVTPDGDRWRVERASGAVDLATAVVVATGGRSVPSTGSTGFGLDLARRLGLDLVPEVAHLAALHGDVDGARGPLGGVADLAGLSVPAVVRVVDRADGRERARSAGSLLFTHRGVTGPAALDVSGAVERALAEGRRVDVRLDLWSLADPDGPLGEHLGDKLPGTCLHDPPAPAAPGEVDVELRAVADAHPGSGGDRLLGDRLPRRLAGALGPRDDVPLGQLTRDERRAVAARVADTRFVPTGTGGWASAEVTAGGVDLAGLDRATLGSRVAPGTFWCGEVCDATGRLGGFNFAWAWASGLVAGRGAAARATAPR